VSIDKGDILEVAQHCIVSLAEMMMLAYADWKAEGEPAQKKFA
jgi:hypothetical protein